MKFKGLFFGLILLSTLFIPDICLSDTSTIKIFKDGQELRFNVEPRLIQGRTMVPFRTIFEAFGAKVYWEDTTKTVIGKKGETAILLRIDSDDAIVNGIETKLDVPAFTENSRTLVPLRFVSESLGAEVRWDEINNSITLFSNPQPALQPNAVNSAIKTIDMNDSITDADNSKELVVRIQDFGAHSIDEPGYSNFDSSEAIQKAIRYAEKNKIKTVDFGSSGRYMCKDIILAGDMIYRSTGAVLFCNPKIETWHAILFARNKKNIVFDGLILDGNQSNVSGTIYVSSFMTHFVSCSNVTIKNCYYHDSWGPAIKFGDDCTNIDIYSNKIQNVDAGIQFMHGVCSYVTIRNNEVLGGKNQYSEPIVIDGTTDHGLSHDIIITDNILFNKLYCNGIFVLNANKVQISKNICYNMSSGIMIGSDSLYAVGKDTPYEISINNNVIFNCRFGIFGSMKDSTIFNNYIYSIKASDIQLNGLNGRKSQNVRITGNKVTLPSNSNIKKAIQLYDSENCILDGNIIIKP